MNPRLLLPLLFVAGCATNSTPSTSLPLGAGASPPSGSLIVGACGVRIQFAAAPRKLTPSETQPLFQMLGNYEKVEAQGWVVDQYRYTETAICVCGETSVGSGGFDKIRADMRENRELVDSSDFEIFGIGKALRTKVAASTADAVGRMQITFPASMPRCALLQLSRMPKADLRQFDFLSRLAPSTAGQ